MHIVDRVDGPDRFFDATATACASDIGVNIGDTIFARIGDTRLSARCVGFHARLEPVPGILPADLTPETPHDSSDANELIGSEVSQTCGGGLSFDVHFDGDHRPLTISAGISDPKVVAFMSFNYGASSQTTCPRSCAAGLYVSVEVLREQDARP